MRCSQEQDLAVVRREECEGAGRDVGERHRRRAARAAQVRVLAVVVEFGEGLERGLDVV